MVGNVALTSAEAIGGGLIAMAAQVHTTARGPLAHLPESTNVVGVACLAAGGGALVGLREFSKAFAAIASPWTRAWKKEQAQGRRPGGRDAAQSSEPFYVWQAYHDLVDVRLELANEATALIANWALSNGLAWSGWAAGASAGGVALSLTVALAADRFLLKRKLDSLPNEPGRPEGQPPYDLTSSDRNTAEASAKRLVDVCEERAWHQAPAMVFGALTTMASIFAAACQGHKESLQEEDPAKAFDDYTKMNLVPSIVNFVALGCTIVLFAETLAKRRKALTIADADLERFDRDFQLPPATPVALPLSAQISEGDVPPLSRAISLAGHAYQLERPIAGTSATLDALTEVVQEQARIDAGAGSSAAGGRPRRSPKGKSKVL
jgi:hypothetical protein